MASSEVSLSRASGDPESRHKWATHVLLGWAPHIARGWKPRPHPVPPCRPGGHPTKPGPPSVGLFSLDSMLLCGLARSFWVTGAISAEGITGLCHPQGVRLRRAGTSGWMAAELAQSPS